MIYSLLVEFIYEFISSDTRMSTDTYSVMVSNIRDMCDKGSDYLSTLT